ncbi:hypothetical protein AB4359_20235 [Vibrio splendidus]
MGVLKRLIWIWYSVVIFSFGILIGVVFFDESSKFIGDWLVENTDRMLGLGGLIAGLIGVAYGWRGEWKQNKQLNREQAKAKARQDLLASRRDIRLRVMEAANHLATYAFWKPSIDAGKVVDLSGISEEQRQQRLAAEKQNQETYDLFKQANQDVHNMIARHDNDDKHTLRAQEIMFTLDQFVEGLAKERYTRVGRFNHRIRISYRLSNETILVRLFELDKESRIID